jgi:hypothetical protein
VRVQLSPVRIEEVSVRVLVAASGGLEQLSFLRGGRGSHASPD